MVNSALCGECDDLRFRVFNVKGPFDLLESI